MNCSNGTGNGAIRNGHHESFMVEETDARVLSIQSHVVHGYVGNKSAVFPLQLLGIEVDIINSVHFSNHTGYKSFGGKHLRLNGDDLHDLMDGLQSNSLLENTYSHLLTGYIGNKTLLEAIVRVHQRIKAANSPTKPFVYVCDPVLGDNGKLYVPQELVDVYRLEMVPIADVLTPNQFECELLTGMKLDSVKDALQACKKLHAMGPQVVVISSFEETSESRTSEERELIVIGSRVLPQDQESQQTLFEQYEIRVPWIDSYYTGTGDLFAALLLAWLHLCPNDFKKALEQVLATIRDVLRTTLRLGGKNCELKLIQSRAFIAKPRVVLHAQPLNVPIRYVVCDAEVLNLTLVETKKLLMDMVQVVGKKRICVCDRESSAMESVHELKMVKSDLHEQVDFVTMGQEVSVLDLIMQQAVASSQILVVSRSKAFIDLLLMKRQRELGCQLNFPILGDSNEIGDRPVSLHDVPEWITAKNAQCTMEPRE